MILARCLQGALDGFSTGVGEEGDVGEAGRGQALGQRFLFLDPEYVGHMPELFGLAFDRLDQPRMGVTQAASGDAGHAVQIFVAVFGEQAHASASVERKRCAVIDAHQMIGRNLDSGVRHEFCSQMQKARRREHRAGGITQGSGLLSTNS